MAEEVRHVKLKRSDSCGLGFSVFGGAGSEFPPTIYDIIEHSPAADSGELETGDIILQINETDVYKFGTKEVLRCLRLSGDAVTLTLKRDPVIKSRIKQLIASNSASEIATTKEVKNKVSDGMPQNSIQSCETVEERGNRKRTLPHHSTNGNYVDESYPSDITPGQNQRNGHHQRRNKRRNESELSPDIVKPRFEAYVMTGDLILNLSRTPQHSDFRFPQKRVDSLRETSSVPSSPNEMEMGARKGSIGPSSDNSYQCCDAVNSMSRPNDDSVIEKAIAYNTRRYVRTSKSEDHLQFEKDSLGAVVDIDLDEDVTSSLNTLLDPRQVDDDDSIAEKERIVWSFNALEYHTSPSDSSDALSPRLSISPPSPASPTSISSSIMSSDSPKKIHSTPIQQTIVSGSERLPNGDMTSPDSNVEDRMLEEEEANDVFVMDDRTTRQKLVSDEHKIVIEVKGPEHMSPKSSPTTQRRNEYDPNLMGYTRSPSSSSGNVTPELLSYQELRESEDEITTLSEAEELSRCGRQPSPPLSEDESDIESLHSFHYSPKAVDLPSAIRLAKRLFGLEGFKKSDVSRHLSKNNDFSRVVADEYLKYFTFESDTLDVALRKFLKQFSLTGETQERERVLVHFSKRYLDCNPGSFNSQDAVHTLTCAIMLLNTDLHGQNVRRKMVCNEFIENLADLNDGENFQSEVLKQLFHAIKTQPLEWAVDEETADTTGSTSQAPVDTNITAIGYNPFLDVPNSSVATEYKKGYVMRKCCIDSNGKKTPFGRRGWKMFHCTLKDLVLYLHKDEHGAIGQKNQLYENIHNAIRIHHALATKAGDYTKKQHVFRLQCADQAQYLFQTSDGKELQSWMDTINFVAASLSAAPLASGVGSQKRFQRPLLPCSHTKFNLHEQLNSHEQQVTRLEQDFDEHRRHPPERGTKAIKIQNYKEKDNYLQYELKRYKTYVYLLRAKLSQYPEVEPSLVDTSIGEVDERAETEGGEQTTSKISAGGIVPPPIPDRRVDRSLYVERETHL